MSALWDLYRMQNFFTARDRPNDVSPIRKFKKKFLIA
jgi:hypothetical protein